MDAYRKQISNWWKKAPTVKRWLTAAFAVAAICTFGFLLFSDSFQPTSSSLTSSASQFDDLFFYIGLVAKTIGVLLLIIGGAIVLRWLQRRQNGGRPDRVLAVTESIRLSPKQAIHLFRVSDKYFLVGATDQNLNLISQVEPFNSVKPEGQSGRLDQQSFKSYLADASLADFSVKRTDR